MRNHRTQDVYKGQAIPKRKKKKNQKLKISEIHVIAKIIQVWGGQHFLPEHPQEKMQHKKSGWPINQQRKKIMVMTNQNLLPKSHNNMWYSNKWTAS